MQLGHEYLRKTFGVRPKIGWQIDPFGSSISTPTIFAKMGFDAHVINRIPQTIFDKMPYRAHFTLVLLCPTGHNKNR